MPLVLQAGCWGLLAGSALVLGALIGFKVKVSPRWIAGVMAFGSGVLISALAFELMEEAFERGGATAAGIGMIAGAALFTAINVLLNRRGARHRKRSGLQQAKANENGGSGLAIAAGALLDGIPESIVIGVGMLGGGRVSFVAVVAIFLSNLPEGLSSAAGMKKAGRSATYVFGVWGGIAVVSGLAAMAGYYFFDDATETVIAVTTTFAAGAILAMLADTMIPEAFEEAHDFTGLITVIGFLVSFCLSKVLV